MKFTRRPDLDPPTRIHIVMLAWLHQGVYGKMTEIARSYQISRTFLYQLVFMAHLQLETLFSEETGRAQADLPSFEPLILLLRLEGKCSLGSIASILQALEYSPHSVGYLSQFFQQYGHSLPATLSTGSPKVVFYLSDEIFALPQHGDPPHRVGVGSFGGDLERPFCRGRGSRFLPPGYGLGSGSRPGGRLSSRL